MDMNDAGLAPSSPVFLPAVAEVMCSCKVKLLPFPPAPQLGFLSCQPHTPCTLHFLTDKATKLRECENVAKCMCLCMGRLSDS